jgi:quercetin dioxygenase-like cupin family protein
MTFQQSGSHERRIYTHAMHQDAVDRGWRAVLLLASVLLAGTTSRVAGEEVGGEVKPVRVEKLPNVPGKTLTAVVVTYAPGGKSGAHQHAGSVFAYVLSGAIRSENSATGPAKVYKAGESFFEPPGS